MKLKDLALVDYLPQDLIDAANTLKVDAEALLAVAVKDGTAEAQLVIAGLADKAAGWLGWLRGKLPAE